MEMSHEVIEQTGGLLGTGLTMVNIQSCSTVICFTLKTKIGCLIAFVCMQDLDHPIVTTYSANPPVTIDVSMTDLSSGLLAHSQLTTIDQSELSSQLGLSLGGGTILPPVQSPEDHLSPTASPTSSLHDEDMEDFRRVSIIIS